MSDESGLDIGPIDLGKLRKLDWSKTRRRDEPPQEQEVDHSLDYLMAAVERADRGDTLPGEVNGDGMRVVDGVAVPVPVPVTDPREVNIPSSRKRGAVVLWCDTCGEFKSVKPTAFIGLCPECGQPMMKQRCTRCDHTWWPRDPKRLPGSCPKCKSPYYNRGRIR